MCRWDVGRWSTTFAPPNIALRVLADPCNCGELVISQQHQLAWLPVGFYGLWLSADCVGPSCCLSQAWRLAWRWVLRAT